MRNEWAIIVIIMLLGIQTDFYITSGASIHEYEQLKLVDQPRNMKKKISSSNISFIHFEHFFFVRNNCFFF